MTLNEIVQILSGFIGSLGFAVLFNIRGVRLIITALGGLFSWLLFVVLSKFVSNDVVNYFIVAFVISVYAEVMARVVKTPTSTFITTALISLIPGGALYYTMASAFESDLQNFIEKAVDTLQLAAALALGIIVAATLTKIFYKIVGKIKA